MRPEKPFLCARNIHSHAFLLVQLRVADDKLVAILYHRKQHSARKPAF